MTIGDLMALTNNYFMRWRFFGSMSVVDGALVGAPDIADGYYLIDGSLHNAGVHRVGDPLEDEGAFTGYVVRLAPWPSFVALAENIAKWSMDNAPSALTSESVGGYSRTWAQGATWASAYKDHIAPFVKLPQPLGQQIHLCRRYKDGDK